MPWINTRQYVLDILSSQLLRMAWDINPPLSLSPTLPSIPESQSTGRLSSGQLAYGATKRSPDMPSLIRPRNARSNKSPGQYSHLSSLVGLWPTLVNVLCAQCQACPTVGAHDVIRRLMLLIYFVEPSVFHRLLSTIQPQVEHIDRTFLKIVLHKPTLLSSTETFTSLSIPPR